MTLILEFERKLIFYKPGILRYAMRLAGSASAADWGHERGQRLSRSLKRGWAEARAERDALQRLKAVAQAELVSGKMAIIARPATSLQ